MVPPTYTRGHVYSGFVQIGVMLIAEVNNHRGSHDLETNCRGGVSNPVHLQPYYACERNTL